MYQFISQFLQTHSTNPLITSFTIDAAVDAFHAGYPTHHDSLFSVNVLQTRLYDVLGRALNHNASFLIRTQDLPPVYEENSVLYVFNAADLFQRRQRIGVRPLMFKTPPDESHDIDTAADWDLVQSLLAARRTVITDAPCEETFLVERTLPSPPYGPLSAAIRHPAYTVLVSAPYILPHMNRFGDVLGRFGLRILLPDNLQERLTEEQLLALAGTFDATICGDDAYTERVLRACRPRLKVISKWGTGIDSIDQRFSRSIGVAVCNTPGAFTEPVADSAMAYILAFARNVPGSDAAMKARGWEKLAGRSLCESTIGLVGCGAIGQALCTRLRGFGACVLFVDPVAPPCAFLAANTHVNEAESLRALLAAVHFVVLCCDLNPTSKHIINEESLACMRPDAVLINTARGPLVDEAALISALQCGVIAGAALDVYEHEPLRSDSPLRSMSNVLLAPHNANASPRAHERVHWNTIGNLLKALDIPFKGDDLL